MPQAFISGGYTVTYDGSDIGQIEDGIRLIWGSSSEEIRGDLLGDAVQDAVYRCGNMFIEMVLLEYNAAGAIKAFWPWHATLGLLGTPGRLESGLAKSLVLTAVAGTPAVASPATLTATKAILAQGTDVNMLFAPRLRKIPLRMRIYPYLSTDYKFFATT